MISISLCLTYCICFSLSAFSLIFLFPLIIPYSVSTFLIAPFSSYCSHLEPTHRLPSLFPLFSALPSCLPTTSPYPSYYYYPFIF